MQKITTAESLRKSILVLELRQIEEGKLLLEQAKVTYESLRPLNFLRKMFGQIATPSSLRENLIQSATGLISGYVSRKVFIRSSRNPVMRLAGILVQYGVTNFVANNADTISTLGHYYADKFLSFFHKPKQ